MKATCRNRHLAVIREVDQRLKTAAGLKRQEQSAVTKAIPQNMHTCGDHARSIMKKAGSGRLSHNI
ncbi:hypothetical protein [Arcticibacter sp. MXS-1]|uniref:hypothetical protein n=1 Tax=Arcticibacter sp. MXS-1 TaxID=3341726 RepID=UPI0035A8DAD6